MEDVKHIYCVVTTFFQFSFTMNDSLPIPEGYNYISLPVQTLAYIIFCSLFLFSFCPWPYALNVQTSSCKGTDVFSVANQVFRNLF